MNLFTTIYDTPANKQCNLANSEYVDESTQCLFMEGDKVRDAELS